MSGVNGRGTKLLRGDGGTPEVFTAVANLTSIKPPALKRDTIEVSDHDSPDSYREFIGGMKDGGEMSGEVNYRPTVHNMLAADIDDINPRNWKIQFPDPAVTTWNFAAVMTGFESDAPFDDKLAATVTYKITGKPYFS